MISPAPLHPPENTPSAWMMSLRIAFPFPVPFFAWVSSDKRNWVNLAKHRSYRLCCFPDLCHILAQRHHLRRFVEPLQFSNLQDKCRLSLHRLQAESENTLNCLRLV